MGATEGRPPPGAQYEGRTERITDAVRVAGLLAGIVERRSLLTITMDGAPEPYNSALLAVNRERGYVVLDELTPRRGHESVAPGRRLHAYARVRGVEMRFGSEVQAIVDEGDAMAYRLAFPDVLDYRQRRAHYRARLRGRRAAIALLADPGEAIRGELRDISVGGVGAEFQKALPGHLGPGARVPARIDVTEAAIRCEIEICFVNRSLHNRTYVVGARFVGLDPADQKRIAQLVAAIDRESIRHEPASR